VTEDEAAGSRVVLRELIAADEDEFLGLARASVGLHRSTRTATTAMFHRCRYDDTDVPSVRWRGLGGRGREWVNGT